MVRPPYRYVETSALAQLLGSDGALDIESAFYSGQLNAQIGEMVELVLEEEAPVLHDVLVRRISMNGLQFSRTGSRIRKRLEGLIAKQAHVTNDLDGGKLVWANAAQAQEPVAFRPVAAGAAVTRSINEVPLVELVSLARELIVQGLDGDALLRAMGPHLGVSSVRGSSRKRLEQAMEAAWSAS